DRSLFNRPGGSGEGVRLDAKSGDERAGVSLQARAASAAGRGDQGGAGGRQSQPARCAEPPGGGESDLPGGGRGATGRAASLWQRTAHYGIGPIADQGCGFANETGHRAIGQRREGPVHDLGGEATLTFNVEHSTFNG